MGCYPTKGTKANSPLRLVFPQRDWKKSPANLRRREMRYARIDPNALLVAPMYDIGGIELP